MPPPISLGTLTIANGTADSEAISFVAVGPPSRVSKIAIHAPAVLPESIIVMVRPAGGTWRRLQSGGADIAVTVGDTTVIDTIAYSELRVSTDTGNVAADRVFNLEGREDY